jgi:hypothetical protein
MSQRLRRRCSNRIAAGQAHRERLLIVNRKISPLYVVKQAATLDCYCGLMLIMNFCSST